MTILNLVQRAISIYEPKNAEFSIEKEQVVFNYIVDENEISLKYEQELERLSILTHSPLPTNVQVLVDSYGFQQDGWFQTLFISFDNPEYLIKVMTSILEAIDNILDVSNTETQKNSRKICALYGDYIDDEGNRVDAPEGLHNVRFQFRGMNNSIKIHPEAGIRNVSIQCVGDNANVYIGKNVRMSGNWRLGYNCELIIKDRSTSTNAVYMTCAEGTSIIIGEDCMFATSNQIRTDDAHAIYDVKSGSRVNASESIVIGDHVWVSYGATIFGGSKIGEGSIVGAFSLTNKVYPNNCILAGSPAKVVKEDVCWERPNVLYAEEPARYIKENLKSSHFYNLTSYE